ncbi:MAG TPA: ATP-binding protein, partial [Candidatus Binatia bacterium]|nr:ATP-binding protein [Candidatus Binatia bacterium]
DSGAVDYVSVPIIPEILRAKVSVFADRFRKTEELQRLNRELEERVAARTQEIEASASRLRASEERLRQALHHAEQARAEAEQANRLKDQFLAVLSHELRSPLSAILGWVQILRTRTLDAAIHEKAVDTISRNAHLQSRIISDILDVSAILAGKLRLQTESVEVSSVITAALDTLRPAAKAKSLRIDVALDDHASLPADPVRLQQIVWNVLSNAIDFAPESGEVRIHVATSPTTVSITVQDDGPGIRTDFLPYIFDRFRQQDSSSVRSHHGLGLGLAIVKHLVDLHGGTVQAANRHDRSGAIFTIALPRAARVAKPSDAPTQRPAADESTWLDSAPSLDGIRVLIVDDVADTREVVAEMLRRCGAQTAVAASVAQAVGLLESQLPDVVLADIEMPVEDGYGLLRRIRALPIEKGGAIPVAALTAYASEQDRANALAAGFAVHVPKPVHPLDLAKVVERLAVNGRSPRRVAAGG